MGVRASQTTGDSKQSKFRSTSTLWGESTGNGGFSSQMGDNTTIPPGQ